MNLLPDLKRLIGQYAMRCIQCLKGEWLLNGLCYCCYKQFIKGDDVKYMTWQCIASYNNMSLSETYKEEIFWRYLNATHQQDKKHYVQSASFFGVYGFEKEVHYRRQTNDQQQDFLPCPDSTYIVFQVFQDKQNPNRQYFLLSHCVDEEKNKNKFGDHRNPQDDLIAIMRYGHQWCALDPQHAHAIFGECFDCPSWDKDRLDECQFKRFLMDFGKRKRKPDTE